MAGKSKVTKSGKLNGAKGGSTKMFGRQHAGPQKPGTAAHATSGSGGKYARGGSGHMFGKQHAGKKTPGSAGKTSGSG